MKRILLPLVISSAVFLAACGDKKDTTSRDMVLLTDSSHNSSLATDTAAGQAIAQSQPQAPVVAAPPVQSTSPAPRQTRPRPVYDNNQPTTQAPVVTPDPQPTQPTVTPDPTPTTETAGTGTTGTEGTTEGTGTTATTPAKKKGISNSAKGAIIGGVGGAVAGAVIGKGGKGAVIGGVIGAAGGYIIGKKKDKKAADSTGN